MKTMVWILILINSSSVLADTTMLPALKEKIQLLCPDAVITETEFRDGFTEVEYICNGKNQEVGFDENYNVVYRQTDAEADEKTYNKIIKKLDKSHSGWIMDDFNLIETTDTSFFVVEMEKNGIESNVYFTLDGKHYKPMNVSAGEELNNVDFEALYRNRKSPYNFLRPHHVYDLPELAREVSGIVMASEDKLYLVQDELGAVFEFDLNTEQISGMIRFTDEGDFEDIAYNGTSIYVLRSDGMIFQFQHGKPEAVPVMTRVPVQVTDLEGLFFDTLENRLLLAGKDEPVNNDSHLRYMYRMNSHALHAPEIWLKVSIREINDTLKMHYPALTKQEHDFTFNPSAIAIHPKTGETYILSATDRLLAVYKNTMLKEVFPLPAELYYKPEGLSFSTNGNLYISSEGIKNGWLNGRIFMFKPER